MLFIGNGIRFGRDKWWNCKFFIIVRTGYSWIFIEEKLADIFECVSDNVDLVLFEDS